MSSTLPTTTWTGDDGNSDASDPNNWSNGLPQDGEIAVIGDSGSGAASHPTVNVPSGYSLTESYLTNYGVVSLLGDGGSPNVLSSVSLVNYGTVDADGSNASATVDPGTIQNNGIFKAENGATLTVANTLNGSSFSFANLSGPAGAAVLTGGEYDVVAGGTTNHSAILIQNATVAELGANTIVRLGDFSSSPAAEFLSGAGQQSLDQTLAKIDQSALLEVQLQPFNDTQALEIAGIVQITNSNFSADGLTIDAGAVISGSGVVGDTSGNAINNPGAISAIAGTLEVSSAVSGNGTFQILGFGGGTLQFDATATDGSSQTYADVHAGQLVFDHTQPAVDGVETLTIAGTRVDTSTFQAPIFGLRARDVINLTGIQGGDGYTIDTSGATPVLNITSAGTTVASLAVQGLNSSSLFKVTNDASGTHIEALPQPPVQVSNTFHFDVSQNLYGTSGGLPGTGATDQPGENVVAISTDGINFTPVDQTQNLQNDGDYNNATDIHDSYLDFRANADGTAQQRPYPNTQALIDAIQANNEAEPGPLTSTFYYQVSDGNGNTVTDQVTYQYSDIAFSNNGAPPYSTAESVAESSTTAIPGLTVSKDLTSSQIANNQNNDSAPLSVTVSLFDFGSNHGDGTLSVTKNGTETVTIGQDEFGQPVDGLTITGTQAQINADLATLVYTAPGTPGHDAIEISAVDGPTSTATYIVGNIETAPTPCFVTGTRISTVRGGVAVEDLRVGDLVVTASGEERPITWIGHRHVDIARHPEPEAVWPLRIEAGAFGGGKPDRDLWMSPRHSLFCEGVLMPIVALANGGTIAQVRCDAVTYWHVELESHDILLAEGLPAESFLDCGNRTAFVNGGAFLELHPDFRAKHWLDGCAPLKEAGAEVEAVRARLLACAETLGHRLTQDPDLHLTTGDGTRIDPETLDGGRYAFAVPAGCSDLRLVSRRWVPAQLRPEGGDARTLGLCLRSLTVDGKTVPLSCLAGDGWHETERDGPRSWRWTSGAAVLPTRARTVTIELAGQPSYWLSPRSERRDRQRLVSQESLARFG